MTSTTMASDLAREALEPFANAAEEWVEMGDTRPLYSGTELTVGDLRRAKSALASIEVPDGPYGWLIKPVGLAESEWDIATEPEPDTTNFVSVPLYCLHPQILGATQNTGQPARTAYDAIGSGVKALEWREPTDHPQDNEDALLVADGLGGRYSISQRQSLHNGGTGHLLWWAHDGFSFAEFHTPNQAKAAAQADFERRVLSCLSTHTAAGAGPVGEAVAWAYEFHEFGDVWKRHVILNRPDGGANPPTKHHGSAVRNVRALGYTLPVEEPGEVERGRRIDAENDRDRYLEGQVLMEKRAVAAEAALAESEQNAQGLASDLAGTQAALAETRERLEKMEGAARPFAKIAEHDIGTDETDADFFRPMDRHNRAPRLTVGNLRALHAALTGAAQEAGR